MAEEKQQNYTSMAMWVFFYIHLALFVVTGILLTIINLMMMGAGKDLWVIWIWIYWGLLILTHYGIMLFFHSKYWKTLKEKVMTAIKDKM
jgi:2TM domain